MTFSQLLIIALIPTIVTAIVGFFTHFKLNVIRRDVDGKMKQLIELVDQSAFDRGKKVEKDKQDHDAATVERAIATSKRVKDSGLDDKEKV